MSQASHNRRDFSDIDNLGRATESFMREQHRVLAGQKSGRAPRNRTEREFNILKYTKIAGTAAAFLLIAGIAVFAGIRFGEGNQGLIQPEPDLPPAIETVTDPPAAQTTVTVKTETAQSETQTTVSSASVKTNASANAAAASSATTITSSALASSSAPHVSSSTTDIQTAVTTTTRAIAQAASVSQVIAYEAVTTQPVTTAPTTTRAAATTTYKTTTTTRIAATTTKATTKATTTQTTTTTTAATTTAATANLEIQDVSVGEWSSYNNGEQTMQVLSVTIKNNGNATFSGTETFKINFRGILHAAAISENTEGAIIFDQSALYVDYSGTLEASFSDVISIRILTDKPVWSCSY